MIKLSKTDWMDWLSKPEWSAAEAAALSLGVNPMNVMVITEEKIEHHITFGDGLDNPEAKYIQSKLQLSNHAKGLGKSLEQKIQVRAAKLLGLKQYKSSGIERDLAQVAGSPSELIAEMKYEEWDLPSEMKQFRPEEVVITKPVSYAAKDSLESMKKTDKTRAKVRAKFEREGIPSALSVTELTVYINMSRSQIMKLRSEGVFPEPMPGLGGEGNEKLFFDRAVIDTWLNGQK
jgi:hypothetical protein